MKGHAGVENSSDRDPCAGIKEWGHPFVVCPRPHSGLGLAHDHCDIRSRVSRKAGPFSSNARHGPRLLARSIYIQHQFNIQVCVLPRHLPRATEPRFVRMQVTFLRSEPAISTTEVR